MLNNLALKIRRRETPFYDRLYRTAKAMRGFEVPLIRPLHSILYHERSLRLSLWRNFWRVVYHQPVFKSRCESAGKIHLIGGIPLVMGHLKLYLGDGVTIHGQSTFIGAKNVEEPKLIVGHRTHLGYGITISVAEEVRIGNRVMIANRVHIAGYDGHPLDPAQRSQGLPAEVDKENAAVVIGDEAWIGESATLLKGIHVGEAAIVAAGSLVTRDVPPYTVVAGNPAKIVKEIPR